jgi:Dolichyl-phosphate-mannose-protein mannosyltransferase
MKNITTSFKQTERLFLWLTVLLICIVRIRLADAPMERDEGEYAYAGWKILRGGLPYLDFYNMKLPGVYFSYALIFKLIGETISAVRLTVLGLNLATAFFIFKIGERSSSGWISAGVYLLLSMGFAGQGFIANTEFFVVFWAILGILLSFEKEKPVFFLLAGICFALSFLMKQHTAIYSIFILFYIWQQSRDAFAFLKKIGFLVIGTFIPLSTLAFYIYKNHLWDNFYYWVIQYAAAYSKILSPTLSNISTFRAIALENLCFWLINFTWIFLFFKNKAYRADKNWKTCVVFFGVSVLTTVPGWYFRPHYFQLLYPAAALLVAYGFKHVKWDFSIGRHLITATMVLNISFLSGIIVNSGFYFIKTPVEITHKIYRGTYFTEIKNLGEYLNKITQTDDKIGLYSCDPQLLFYANRAAASGFLYRYPLIEPQQYAPEMVDKYMAELNKNKPQWFVFMNSSRIDEWKAYEDRLEKRLEPFLNDYKICSIMYKIDEITVDWHLNTSEMDTSRNPIIIVYQRK